MIRTAKLYARFSDPDGKYPRVPVAFGKNGKPVEPTRKDCVLTEYLVRVGKKFIGVGADFPLAVVRLHQEQARLSEGVPRYQAEKDVAPSAEPEAPGRIRLVVAAEEYKRELRTLDKARNTVLNYTLPLNQFVESCSKKFVDEIDRKDILAYIDWMRQNLPKRTPDGQNRTISTRLQYLNTFLSKYGVKLRKDAHQQAASDPGLLYRTDFPKIVKKKPRKFDQETIDQLLAVADVDERDYLEFLLWSGFRDEEAQYLQFADLDIHKSTAAVCARPQFGWKPKDYEEREVTLPTAVSKRMKERMERARQYQDGIRKAAEDDLVFPNNQGRPDNHLILRLHAVAKKAGLNLVGKRAQHMFRKTAGSRVAKKEGLPAAMEFLGHSNIETTALYLAADTTNLTKKRQTADEMYEHHQLQGGD